MNRSYTNAGGLPDDCETEGDSVCGLSAILLIMVGGLENLLLRRLALTRALLGLWIFHHLLGGGGGV